MRAIIVTVAALSFAGAAHARTPPAQTSPGQTPAPTNHLTRDLNAGPPAPAVYLAPPPVTVAEPGAAPSAPEETASVPAPRAVAPPAVASPPRAAPIAAAPAIQPRTAPTAPPRTETPAGAPEEAAPAAPPPAAPALTVLDAAARAALPFTVDLPPGFEIVSGRPGPDFRVYTIRRGDRSFVMVYAGPASQFPIYSGQMVEAGGRASVVVTENGVRHAREHLFQRSSAPNEIHIWAMSLDGADRAMAEQIAQTVDVR